MSTINTPFGRIAIAESFKPTPGLQTAALPFYPGMPPGGQNGQYVRGIGGYAGVGGIAPGIATYPGGVSPSYGSVGPTGVGAPIGYGIPLFPKRQIAAYGADVQGSSGSNDLSTYQQAGAVAGAYASAADVRRAIAKKQADLDALVNLKAKQPWMASVLDWQISRISADIGALQQKLALQVEGEDSTRTWRSLGQTGTAVAVIAGIGVVALIATELAKRYRARRTNPSKRRGRR